MAANMLSPFVYWGQTVQTVSLKVDLRTVENIDVNLTEESLSFSADGLGVKGLNKYGFNLEFYLPVNPEGALDRSIISENLNLVHTIFLPDEGVEKSKYRRTDLAIEFQIEKTAAESWPRLTAEKVKLPWLKIDFDKFLLEDSEGSSTENEEKTQKEMIDDMVSSLSSSSKSEMPSLKQTYLLLYNLFQFIGYAYIVGALLIRLFKYNQLARETAFEAVGNQMMVCQTVAVLEVVHSAVGLVKSNALTALAQVVGRNFILFVLVLQEPRLQMSPLCWYLFITWSSIELIRYPYYMFQILGKEMRWLTWLRYSAWIPLYPVGILIEMSVVVKSINFFGETGNLSFQLPNNANFAFYFPYFLMAYLLLMLLGGSNNLNYMYLQRKKQLYETTHSSKNGKFKAS